jgi:PEP-CTERM motif
MKTKFQQLFIALSVLAVLTILPAAVKADPITFTLDDNHSVAAGSSVTFFGTLSNGGAPGRFINGLSFNFASGAPGSITVDDSAFFANVPAFLGPATSTGLEAFFDVVVSALVPPGVYGGSVSVLGGDDANAINVLGAQEFTITVTGGDQLVPEPATMLLLGSGLAGLAAARRRKRRRIKAS